jgi:EmrB/QacA subfamily drug resistance transporter
MATMTDASPVRVVGLTAIASLMVTLDLLVVSTALTTIRRDLDASAAQLQWTVTAYGLAFACLLLAGAALGDRFGRRRMFLCGLLVFAVASAACALAPGVGWLIAARAVQGVGAALVLPLAVALLTAAVAAEHRGRALGVFEGVTGLAAIVGPPLGGALAQSVGWEWIFWINVPIAAAMVALVRRWIPESHGSGGAIDICGMLLATGAGFGLIWALARGNESGWTSPGVLPGLIIGTALAVAFVGWERRCSEPMLPMALFRSRAFSAGTAASFLGFAALYGSVYFLAQFLQTGLGYSPIEAGVRLVPWTATLLVIAPMAGMLADRVGDRPVLTAGLALQAIGLAWVGLVASPDLGYAALVLPLIVAGIGASMAIPVVQNTVLGDVPLVAVGRASGVSNAAQELGGAFGVAILVAGFSAAGSYATPATFVAGFSVAMGACAALAAAAAVAACFVPGRGVGSTSTAGRPGDVVAPGADRQPSGATNRR